MTRPRRRPWRVLVLLLGAAAMSAPLAAQAPPPDAEWRTLRTPHFRVTFTPELEPIARHAAAVAERGYEVLARDLTRPPSGTIDLLVTDHVDVSNGYATPLPSNRIVVHARPPLEMIELAYMRDWIELVVIHELTHIFHLDRTSGFGAALRTVFGRLPLPWPVFPVLGTPLWSIEGLATEVETRMTGFGRVAGSFHAMVARTAVLEARPPRLGELGPTSPVWPGGHRAYVYGSLFLDWLGRQHGDSVHTRMIEATADAWIPTFLAFDRIGRAAAGRGFDRLYRDWLGELAHEARTLRDSLTAAGLTPTEPVVDDAPYAVHARVSPDGGVVSYAAHDYRSDPATRLVPAAGGAPRTLARRNQFGQVLGPASWLPDGRRLVVSQLEFADPYRVRGDLWLLDGDDERRLTSGQRLSQPDVAPDGRRIAAVRNDDGATTLVVYDVETDRLETLAEPPAGGGWAAPRWAPDGRRLAASRWRAGGWYDVVVLHDDGTLEPITDDRALDTAPAWSPDGRWLLFSSDRSGVPNIYAHDTRAADGEPALRQVTNVLTGAFQPEVSADGTWLYLTVYHVDGFHLERTPFEPAGWRAPAAPRMPPRPAAIDDAYAPPSAASTAYSPLPTLWPRFWLPFAGDYEGTYVGVVTFGRDLVGRHTYDVLARWTPSAGRLEGGIGWSWAGLGNPVLALRLERDHELIQRLETVEGRSLRFAREDRLALSAQVLRRRWRHAFALAAGGELSDVDLVDEGPPLAPIAEPRPLLGAFVRPAFANYRLHPYSISREDGIATTVQLRRRWRAPGGGLQHSYDEAFGRAAGYLAVRGPGFANHVLAARASGLVRAGPDAPPTAIGGEGGGLADLVIAGGGVALPVRGYRDGARIGTLAWTASAEYRFPLLLTGAPGLLGLRVDKLSGALFADAGDAWCHQPADVSAACPGRAATPLVSAGAELAADFGILSGLPLQLRLGVAVLLVEPRAGELALYASFGSLF